MDNYVKYHRLEQYLLDEVNPHFREQGYLEPEDFFCIVIWKANRAKSLIAARLLKIGDQRLNLAQAVKALTEKIAQAQKSEERMRVLFEGWGFHLPMASAILTILYPEDFTVYDVRVATTLDRDGGTKFRRLSNVIAFENMWAGYEQFKEAVANSTSLDLPLRDKDRNLWGRSFYEQLQKDLKNEFRGRPTTSNSP